MGGTHFRTEVAEPFEPSGAGESRGKSDKLQVRVRTMSILNADNISKRFGGDFVLEDISFQFAKGQRVALIGVNGSGKSTLLRMIMGQEELTRGKLTKAGKVNIGYLSQEPNFAGGSTLFQEVMSSKAEVLKMEEQLRELEIQLADAGDNTALLEQYGEIQEKFLHAGGYDIEAEIRKILTGLGFSRDDESKSVATMSGGERARVALAKLLLEVPDVLLLDEPTNHLDLAAIEWLENYLSDWKGGFIISSHDRYLIDQLADRIWEIEDTKLNEFAGNYTKYLVLKDAEVERQHKLYEEQQEFIKKSQDFIRRNIAGGEARENAAKSRRLALEKIEKLDAPYVEKTFGFRIEMSKPSGQEVLNLKNLTVGFDSKGPAASDSLLFHCAEAHIRQNERVALIGPNGSGKTSFLRAATGKIDPLAGEMEFGHNVQPSYFRQNHWEEMQEDQSVIDCLMMTKHQRISEAREFLGRFLFSGDDVYKKIGELSGGQRSRLALARLAQLEGNLLLLDEPTNHLDIRSREVLQDALRNYDGTMLFVSHDRYLIQALATQVWEIRDGHCRIYRGDYEFFLRYRSEELSSLESREKAKKASGQVVSKRSANSNKEQEKVRRKLEKREAELAAKLVRLESLIEDIEDKMASASYEGNHEQTTALGIEYEERKLELRNSNAEWSQVVEDLKEFSGDFAATN